MPISLRSNKHASAFLAFAFSSLCSLCLCGESSAALDPELDKPYQLTIVVHTAQHPLLKGPFVEQIKRELRDSIRAALGDLAQVDVADQHPLLKDIEAKGLQPALEAWKQVSDHKTHFVLINFVDGNYDIQAGQHDGLTGLPSPVARQVKTPDRQLVARLAALMIDRDFGMVGTIDPNAKGDEVKVSIKGGGLGVPLDPWIAKGDVLAISQIKKAGKEMRPWALLRVMEEPKDGVCRCQLFHRRKNPLETGSGVLGYRCLKLSTTTAPLHLRLVNEMDRSPLAGKGVTISANDFGATAKEQYSTPLDGTIRSKESYQNIAFVRVLDSGGEVQAKIPVPIVDDHLVICPLGVNREDEALGELEFNRKRWLRRVYESHLARAELVKELNRLIEGGKGEAALEAARRGLKTMEAEETNFSEELTSMKRIAQQAPGAQAKALQNSLAEGEQSLTELRAKKEDLQNWTADLETAMKEAQSPKNRHLQEMVQQARLLENEADFDGAINMYEKILREGGEQSAQLGPLLRSVRTHLDKLQKEWAPKDNQHREARRTIYLAWPKMESATEMKAHLEEARKAFQICKAAGDHLTPHKLMNVNIAHLGKLKKEFEGLQGSPSETGDTKAQTIAEVTEELEKLTKEVWSYIASAKK